MNDKKYEIIEQLVVLNEKPSGWSMELNIVKWFDNEPKYDIRDWNEDHSRCGKGITLSEEELKALLAYKKDGDDVEGADPY